ncbi:MAG: 1-acyl-sn-glycerol-3-phosphate acyltransferase [Deltaproteobacteria bacterium]|nr:1-acyl-sn-glycerol-3-phosphate acyltransferase [Deltaproteobacteria bacterium]MBI2500049.1 1-acyl-sn-glycerol-3-phosphate acyltransferase [Deltaproteobacteria bacterium]MBI4197237.1 1-acyl-sn-glycerol-3-phosphate acyltransferase [Deltaproteobacteria bacterium]
MKQILLSLRWLVTLLGGLSMGLFCAVLGPLDRSKRKILKACYYFARIFLPIAGIRIQVSGLQHIDPKSNYIVCSNHQGIFDIFTLMGTLPLPLRFVSKPSYFKIPFIGWGMRGVGHIEITRTHKERDRKTLDELVKLVKEGASIVMFPEGTRTRDGKVGPFKFGAFYVAVHSGIPILPVTIQGSFERMRKGKRLPEPGRISLKIQGPISPSGQTVESLCDDTRKVILSNF